MMLLALPALASAFAAPAAVPPAAAISASTHPAAVDAESNSVVVVPSSTDAASSPSSGASIVASVPEDSSATSVSVANPASSMSVAASDPSSDESTSVGAPAPSIVMPCAYNAPSGVRFDNLIRFQSQYSDYLWSGGTTDGTPGAWRVQIAVCQTSHTASCSQALGAVCVYNLTSLASHLPNVTWPSDLIVAGRLNYSPVPKFSALDPTDDTAGVTLTYDNSPLGFGNAWHTVVQLRCDNRFLTANISAVDLSPSNRRTTIVLAALWACPTFFPAAQPSIAPWQIAVIACSAFVVLYFSLGCCWQAMVKGKPCGLQTCPHPTIWVKGPRIICEACASCCTYLANGCRSENDVYREL